VRVRADDRANFQLMRAQNFQDALGFVAGIDDDGFASCRVAQNRAVTLQQSHRKDFVDEFCAHIGSIASQFLPPKPPPCADATGLIRPARSI